MGTGVASSINDFGVSIEQRHTHTKIGRAFTGLQLYLDAAPKGNVARDIFGGIFGRGVVPSRIFIDLTVYFKVVVASNSFPGTGGMGIAGFEVFRLDGIGGKVLISLDHFAVIALCQNCTIPNRFWHYLLSPKKYSYAMYNLQRTY